MGTLNDDLTEIKRVEDTLTKNKVSRFAYTEEAYKKDIADGVPAYNINKEQNIPEGTADIMKVNQTVIDRGFRAQASSITRMLLNHFLGRLSYNLNKVNDNVSSLLTTLQSHLGKANGIASLDENGRIPYSQLPESALELKGEWDASTNTPELVDGTGTNGDFYVVTVAGTQTFGGKSIEFQVNDRILYNGSTSTWIRLQAGGVYSVNNIEPDETGNITLDAPDVNAVKTINNRSPQEGTGNINLESLRINGKLYDGSIFLDAGVQTIEHGGTGATTARDAANSLIAGLAGSQDVPVDSDYFISQKVNGGPFVPEYQTRPISTLWEYIKGKISSVLGLTENTIVTLRTAADTGYLCKLYQLDSATSDTTVQANNVILLGKIPDPASTAVEDTGVSWDIDVDFYFVRATGHKAAWCNVKAGYGYSNAWRKYGLIETFGVDAGSNYTNPFYLVTVKYNNEYYIGVRHLVDMDGSYAARVKNVNTSGSRNPSTVNNTPLVNMLKVIPYQKTNGTVLNNEIKTSIADFPNTYAPTVIRNGDLVLKSGYARIGDSGVAGSKLTIQGATVNTNSYQDTNPKLEFKNKDDSQNISLTFTDYDSVQAPVSLTLNGNQGDEYFIAPNIKATTNFIGNLTGNATNAYSGMVHSCSTASSTKEKTVSVPGFSLTQGACIRVKFLFGNEVTFPTLDVNDTGAHQIIGSRGSLNELVESNSDVTTRSGLGVASWDTGTVLDLYYDGHSWEVIGDPIVKRFYDGTSNLHKNVSIIGNVQTSILY